VALPHDAVVEADAKTYVYVQDSDGELKKSEVKIGTAIGDSVVVTSGLNIGDYVAVSHVEEIEKGNGYKTLRR